MLHTKFQTSEPGGSDKKMFKYISMHFYDLNLGSAGPRSAIGRAPDS